LWKVFWDRVLQNYLPGLASTMILLISASWVARITTMSHTGTLLLFLKEEVFSLIWDKQNWDAHKTFIYGLEVSCSHLQKCRFEN
jgi:hypothetical protein